MIDIKKALKTVLFAILPSFRRLVLTLTIAALVAIVCVLIYNSPPRQYTSVNLVIDWSYDPRSLYPFDKGFEYNILLDPHCHTTYSDGSLTPEQNILFHIANGYNAMIVTDHNELRGSLVAQQIAREKYNDKIKVLTGLEWSNCRCHLNFIGINQTITPIKNPTDQDIQNAIKQVHDIGGIVIYNHRPWSTWSSLDSPTIQQFAAWGVDYFDIANTYYFDMQTLFYARSINAGICTANDFHSSTPATGWTIYNAPNTNYNASEPINASYFTEETLFELIKSKNNSFLFDVTGTGHDIRTTKTKNPTYDLLNVFIKIGQFFHSYYILNRGVYSFVNGENCGDQSVYLDKAQIRYTVMWFSVFFIGFEILRAILVLVYKFCKMKWLQRRLTPKISTKTYSLAFDEFGVDDAPLLNMSL
ncbi:hypothetical protein CYY_004335 [Polysphondylium violaceum]|uniref:Polymerase/histidinol phosphatase N-terminal domain-containing protein n=1 Tax=Polysphondylium violaceum TaxID=133409 RepID=A0A8J4PX74_9MYCE|nr:hypothetical protein CYY_004335 [Polysphondylium violaceum]